MTDLLWWTATVVLLALTLTQWAGFDGSMPVAVLQSLTPQAMSCALPLGVLAAFAGRWPIVLISVLTLATLAWLAMPVRRARRPARTAERAITVAFGNLLADNHRPADAVAAMAATGADLLVMVEFTPDMHDELDRIVGDRYPHRVADVRPDPAGIAIWSGLPLEGRVVHIVGRPSVDVTLEVDGTTVRVLAIHTTPPTLSAPKWRDEIRAIGDAAEGANRTLLIGDFNAARWHPSFRSLFDRGWRSAHELLGSGWSASWPMRGYPAPPFVRIDHALVCDRITPTEVREVRIPGSDHRGFSLSLVVSDVTGAA